MRTGARGARGALLSAAIVMLWLAPAGTQTALAEDGDEDGEFAVPPAPALAPPRLAAELHVGFSTPLDNHAACPSDAGCVLQSGGGVGASVEQRWPIGIGMVWGYDLSFLDTDSVYELGVQQLLRMGVRFTKPTDIIFHPLFELSTGVMIYGDTFAVDTMGLLLQGFGGAEIELTDSSSLRLGFGLRSFSLSRFHTERDGVSRATKAKFAEALFFEVGLGFL